MEYKASWSCILECSKWGFNVAIRIISLANSCSKIHRGRGVVKVENGNAGMCLKLKMTMLGCGLANYRFLIG